MMGPSLREIVEEARDETLVRLVRRLVPGCDLEQVDARLARLRAEIAATPRRAVLSAYSADRDASVTVTACVCFPGRSCIGCLS